MDRFGFRFREWDVYKDARSFRKEIYLIMKLFPTEERYGLSDQLRRASTSVILNISESTNKNTDRDMRLYINRAHCSLDEVVGCLDCAYDDKYITLEQLDSILGKAMSLAKRLKAFSVYLDHASQTD